MEEYDSKDLVEIKKESDELPSQGSALVFVVGEIVEVMRRMWPGMNKPGGIARITKIHYDSEDGDLLIDVAYVVGGRESHIEEKYVKAYEEDSGRRRVQGRCRFCGSFIHDCLHDQSVDPSTLNKPIGSDVPKKRPLDDQSTSAKPKQKKIRVSNAESLQQRQEQREKEKFERLNEESSRWWDELMDSQEGQEESKIDLQLSSTLKSPLEIPKIDRYSLSGHHSTASERLQQPVALSASSTSSLIISGSNHQPTLSLPLPSAQSLNSATRIHPHIRDVLSIAKAIKQRNSSVDSHAFIRARDLHKEIFTHCIKESSTMSPFIRGEERVTGEIYINATYNTLMRQMDDLALAEKWEMFVLAYNLVNNLHQRALQFKPRQLSLSAMCDDLYSRRLNSEISEEQFKVERYALAQQIFNLDEQQESLFKQIERAGFELTTKLPMKISAVLKAISKGEYCEGVEDEEALRSARKVVKTRLQALTLEVDTISTQFKDVMHYAKIGKGGRGGIVNLCRAFETSMDKALEDVIDDEGSDGSETDEYEEDDVGEGGDDFYAMEDVGPSDIPAYTHAQFSKSRDPYKSLFTKKPQQEDSEEDDEDAVDVDNKEARRSSDGGRARGGGKRDFGNKIDDWLVEEGRTKAAKAPLAAWQAVKIAVKKLSGGSRASKTRDRKARGSSNRVNTHSGYNSDVEQDLIRSCVEVRHDDTRRRKVEGGHSEPIAPAVANLHIARETFESAQRRSKASRVDMNVARIVHEKPSFVNEILDSMLVYPDARTNNAMEGDVLLSLLEASPVEFSTSSSSSGKEAMYSFLNGVWNGVETTYSKSFYSLDSQGQDEFIASFLTSLYSHLHQDLNILFEQILLCSDRGDSLAPACHDSIVQKTENLVKNMVCILFDEGLLLTYISLKRSIASQKSTVCDEDHYLLHLARISEITKKVEQVLVSIGILITKGTAIHARSPVISAWLAISVGNTRYVS